jgi:hypothetical protein
MFAVTVGLAGPKEAFQPILLTARDNVNMQMRDALAHPVINCNEGALGQESLFDSTHQQLGVREYCPNEFGWQVVQGAEVLFGHKQAVSWKDRAIVQEGQGEIVFKHAITGYFSANDVAELAIGRNRVRHKFSRRRAAPADTLLQTIAHLSSFRLGTESLVADKRGSAREDAKAILGRNKSGHVTRNNKTASISEALFAWLEVAGHSG